MRNLLAFFLAVMALASLRPVAAQPVFDYEWIQGTPSDPLPHTAVLRINVHGDCDTPTSPGLVFAGFNFEILFAQNVVDETTAPIDGGGTTYVNIVPESPSDANAQSPYGTPANQATRLLTDYRPLPNAYPVAFYPTLTDRSEISACLWSDFLVEGRTPLGGDPALHRRVAISGIVDRNIVRESQTLLSMRNAVTDAVATNPIGDRNSNAGTLQRSAFLDIKFTVVNAPGTFYSSFVLRANPTAAEVVILDDARPDPGNPLPPIPVNLPVNGASFASTTGNPALLQSQTGVTHWSVIED